MRSAPFRRIVVADSLGWLLFLTEINSSSLENFRNEKIFRKLFRRASKCVCVRARRCAINVFGLHQLGCAWSNSIVPVCLRSIEFLRVRVQCCVVLVSPGFPQSNSIALCAFICARSNSFMLSRNNDTWWLKYWIPHLNLEKNDVFLISRKLAKKRTGLVNSNTKTWSAQKFKHENLKRTKCFKSQNNEPPGTAETIPGCVDRNTRSRADRVPYPSTAMIVEAYGKLSSGGEGRLTRN